MDFESENVAVTSEVVALATVCGQSFMGEGASGSMIFGYDEFCDELENPAPGERWTKFTVLDCERGLSTDVATQNMVTKILTSGYVYDKGGKFNPNLEAKVREECARPAVRLDNFVKQDGRKIVAAHEKGDVAGISGSLVYALAESHKWVSDFAERARILRDRNIEINNPILSGALEELSGLMELAREVNRKNAMTNVKESAQER